MTVLKGCFGYSSVWEGILASVGCRCYLSRIAFDQTDACMVAAGSSSSLHRSRYSYMLKRALEVAVDRVISVIRRSPESVLDTVPSHPRGLLPDTRSPHAKIQSCILCPRTRTVATHSSLGLGDWALEEEALHDASGERAGLGKLTSYTYRIGQVLAEGRDAHLAYKCTDVRGSKATELLGCHVALLS